jgi:FlaA1/EpsC-like NDP-sugar epimerase
LPHELGDPPAPHDAAASARFESRVHGLFRALLTMERSRRRLVVFGLDVAACVVATFVAFSLRVGALHFPLAPPLIFDAVALPVLVAVFMWKGVYANVLRFSGGRTIYQLGCAVGLYSLPLLAVFLGLGVQGIPRTIAFLQPLVFFLLVAGIRLTARHVLTDMVRARDHNGSVKQVLVYGAGAAGQQLLSSSRHDPALDVVGFLDDDSRLDGQRIDGVPVYFAGNLDDVLQTARVDAILLALPNAPRSRRAEIVNDLKRHRLQVMTLPPLNHLVDCKVSLNDLREVQIEDLLGRDPVKPNELLLARAIRGKVVMVTGAGGSIGSELCRQIAAERPASVVLVEMTEHSLYQIDVELRERLGNETAEVEIVPELVSVADADVLDRVFDKWRPHTVFHAAAYKHVPLVEVNRLSAIRNNILGTLNAAQAARRSEVERFILVSTDKAVRPTNVMGTTKRVCEQILQALSAEGGKTRFAMVRFGNVLGSSGSVVPRFMRQIREGGPVTLKQRDMNRYFMTIPEAASLVIQAAGMTNGGEVFVLDMGNPMRILELATAMIELSGLTVRDENNPGGDIAIEEIGLRPGEKLFEELLISGNPASTKHPRIMMARETFRPWVEMRPLLDQLRACVDSNTALGVLRSIVPEFDHLRDNLQKVG